MSLVPGQPTQPVPPSRTKAAIYQNLIEIRANLWSLQKEEARLSGMWDTIVSEEQEAKAIADAQAQLVTQKANADSKQATDGNAGAVK
jgi:hypothetical protein